MSAGIRYDLRPGFEDREGNIEDRGAGQGDFPSEINGRTDNRFDPDYMRGPTTNLPTHRVVSSLIWSLPFAARPRVRLAHARGH